MIYLHRFSLPSEGAELHFLTDSRENRRTCYTSRYPFGIFFGREVPTLELEPVTILCGGNGSGKTTVLNLMGEKLSLRRGTVFNRSSFFGEYLKLCRTETAPVFRKAKENSRVITSDDVFDYLLDLRYVNETIDHRRKELLEEYADARYARFQMRSMEDYDRLRQVVDAQRKTGSRRTACRPSSSGSWCPSWRTPPGFTAVSLSSPPTRPFCWPCEGRKYTTWTASRFSPAAGLSWSISGPTGSFSGSIKANLRHKTTAPPERGGYFAVIAESEWRPGRPSAQPPSCCGRSRNLWPFR